MLATALSFNFKNRKTSIRFNKWIENGATKPFGFVIPGDDDNLFIINHGMPEGFLWDETINDGVSIVEFYNRITKKGKIKKHLYVLCCYGGLIENNIPQKVTVINKTSCELHIRPYLDHEGFDVYCDEVDDWFSE